MGYNSRVTGRIEIQPPLRWATIRSSDFTPVNRRSESVVYELEDQTLDTNDGQHTVIRAVAVVPAVEDRQSHYGLDDELAQIGREVIAAGSRLHGWLIRSGEEQGDVQRYTIGDSGVVITEAARLSWPDGTAVTP